MSQHIRLMRAADLPAVLRLQAEAYQALVEGEAAIASRLRHAPQHCWVAEGHGELSAYLLAHPWGEAAPPAWNQPLTTLPRHATRFYLHDLALGAAARGSGVARRLIHTALQAARHQRFHEAQLVAVQASVGFWQRMGFDVVPVQGRLAEKLASYDPDARLMGRRL